jgi:hypothetical protein
MIPPARAKPRVLFVIEHDGVLECVNYGDAERCREVARGADYASEKGEVVEFREVVRRR